MMSEGLKANTCRQVRDFPVIILFTAGKSPVLRTRGRVFDFENQWGVCSGGLSHPHIFQKIFQKNYKDALEFFSKNFL